MRENRILVRFMCSQLFFVFTNECVERVQSLSFIENFLYSVLIEFIELVVAFRLLVITLINLFQLEDYFLLVCSASQVNVLLVSKRELVQLQVKDHWKL